MTPEQKITEIRRLLDTMHETGWRFVLNATDSDTVERKLADSDALNDMYAAMCETMDMVISS